MNDPDPPEQPDEPLRWPRDSAEEDFEAHRAAELDELARWVREQPLRPLTDMMESHGYVRDRREAWGRYIVPEWWAKAEPPATACPRCETPGRPVICDLCADAQAAVPDPDSMIAWWEEMPALGRRLHLSARHGIDPWTARPVQIEHEQTVIDAEAGVGVSYARLVSMVPRTSWDLRLGG
jgi:hypothetical protein